MRRIAFMLVGVAALVLCGNQVAMAHGYSHGAYHHPVVRYGYPHYWGGGYAGGYRGYGVGYGGGYGCGAGYAGYGVPYGYGYPQPGFGVSVPNFSLWVR